MVRAKIGNLSMVDTFEATVAKHPDRDMITFIDGKSDPDTVDPKLSFG